MGTVPSSLVVVALILSIVPAACATDDAKPWEQPGTRVGDEITGPDGGKMVWVAAGEFAMGNDVESCRPRHRVRITRGFWLGKCEVSNVQYAKFLNARGSVYYNAGTMLLLLQLSAVNLVPYFAIDGGAYRLVKSAFEPRIGWESYPVWCVTWYGAQAYCSYFGLRLPTEAEWEYAARGPESLNYPWGNNWDRTKCCSWENRGGKDIVALLHAGGPMPVGSLPSGASWCGAWDLAGNVAEWCSDWYGRDYYSASPTDDPPGPYYGPGKVVRGGSWASFGQSCVSAARACGDPRLTTSGTTGGYWGPGARSNVDYYGFRVVLSP